MQNALFMLVGALLGCFGTCGAFYLKEHVRSHKAAAAQVAAVPLDVTLYRFELEPNHLDRFDQWVQFEHAHHAETVATLEREKMYFGAIFRNQVNQNNVIYWLAISGYGWARSDSSPLPIDQEYQMFMNETLKKGSRITLTTEYSLVPPFLVKDVEKHEDASPARLRERPAAVGPEAPAATTATRRKTWTSGKAFTLSL